MRRLLCSFLVLLVALLLQSFSLAKDTAPKKAQPKPAHSSANKFSTRPMKAEQRAIHALNRLTFGARPGDVQRVLAMGVDKWIEQQLAPASIDDHALDARLAPLRTLRMKTPDMLAAFPSEPLIRAVAEGKQPMPTEPARRVVYEVQVAQYRDRLRNSTAKQNATAPNAPEQPSSDDVDSARRLAGLLMTMPPQKRVEMLAGMQADEITKLRFLTPDERQRLVAVLSPEERETFAAMVNPGNVITSELVQGKLLRAIYSERQLQEVMTDFWFNHFNVFIGKDADRFLLTAYERDVIRPNALGKFRDLLTAVARHPAMLYYLDNWLSVGPNSPQAQAAAKRAAANPANAGNVPGLNENYARELMELHTLGVDGGYTQQDVREVARVFTGWSILQPQQGGAFQFDPRRHEPGDKVVLGQTIHGSVLDDHGQIHDGGEQEGLQVLDLLAQQPATAHFIAHKLAIRFMSDDPPPALVEHMAQTFQTSGGDIREVLRTLFRSREFWSEGAYRAKTKTPLEYVISAARASGADVQNPQPLQQALQAMGMPVYGALPPTGYKNTAEAWLNSDALLERLNFALALANGRLNGVRFDSGRMVASSLFAEGDAKRLKSMRNAANGRDVALALAEGALVAGGVSRQTEKSIQKQLDDPKLLGNAALDPAKPLNAVAALVLGSPEFQKR